MIEEHTIVTNQYFDSVFLMRVAKRIGDAEGIKQAAAVMATAKNLDALAQAGYAGVKGLVASPSDLIVAIKAESTESASRVLDRIEDWLAAEHIASTIETVTSLDEAVTLEPESNLAIISIPGEYAALEAHRALNLGLNVFIFSDNVALDDEIEIKRFANDRGLIVMGPDCGTSIIGGVGIGFANSVRRGSIGVVGPSGTGIQEVTSLIHNAGSGISQAIGTGSRDLSDAVGGISTLSALDALEADPETKVIVIVSKPPGKSTLKRLRKRMEEIDTPVVTCFIGERQAPDVSRKRIIETYDLAEAAHFAIQLINGSGASYGTQISETVVEAEKARMGPGQKYVRGIFSGGTLSYQAQVIMAQAGLKVYSNAALDGNLNLPDSFQSLKHSMIDMGADDFTRGRPHPMIDPTLREERIRAESQDPEVAVLLLDFILGYGASDDPAGDLVTAIVEAKETVRRRGGHLTVVASNCGTPEDAQGLSNQNQSLEAAGVLVTQNSVEAARFAGLLALSLDERGSR